MGVQEQLLARAGRRARTAMRAAYPSLREPLEGGVCIERSTPSAPEHPLDGVTFVSPGARRIAEEAELSWADFSNSPIGATGQGGYKMADVRSIIKDIKKGQG